MNHDVMLLCVVFVPTLGALLLPLIGRVSVGLRNWSALACVVVPLVLSLALVPGVFGGGNPVHVERPLNFLGLAGFSFNFHADGLALFMAIVSTLVSSIIVLYSMSYISHYGEQNEYYLMVVLFLGGMMGLVFAGNLILLYVFWEITAIASWRLIGFFREKQHVVRADKAFLVTVFGALLMLLGFIVVYQQFGTFDLAALKGKHIPDLAAGLILVGLLTKSATLPFHTWLPDAGVAPSPVTALLHAAVLVKIGVYVFARLFLATFVLSGDWQTAVLVIAAASALVSAGAALVDTDLKRIIAYSTVSQIAFIFLGFAAGGTEVGIAGGLLYIAMHGLAKGGLFLCAGIVEQNTHTKDITQMGGLMKTMPVTAISFVLCAFSVMGIPPFGGFFSKYMVISGSVQGAPVWVPIVFIAGAILTVIYLLRVFNMVFLGTSRGATGTEKSPVMVCCVAALALMSLMGGIFINEPFRMAQVAAQQMLGKI